MKTSKNWRKATLLGALAFTVTAVTACSSKADTGSQGKSPSGAPTDISIMTMFFTQQPPDDNNPVKKEMEKRTNTNLKIDWVSPNNYTDKQNVVLASGDIPDMMLVSDPNSPVIQKMEAQGAFKDISPYIKDYKNLAKIPDITWNNVRYVDGKTYILPRPRPINGSYTIFLRQDWLKKLNLKVPETMDDLYNVMKAFTLQDPDGNGQNDTIGFSGTYAQFVMFEDVFTGANGMWKVKDGKLSPSVFEPGEKQYLTFMNKLYNEKLIPQDFPVIKGTQVNDMLSSGKAGIGMNAMNQSWSLGDALRKIKPDADFLPLPYLIGADGKKFIEGDYGYLGGYVIPKKISDDKLKKILAFMDYGATDEGADLANYGIPDVDYTVKDGVKKPTPQAAADNVSANTFGQIFNKYDKYFRATIAAGIPADIADRNKKIIDEMDQIKLPKPDGGLVSETNTKVGSEIWKSIDDMKVKIIIGKEKLDAWDDFVSKLKANPDLQKITAEMNALYAKKQAAK